MAVPDQIVATRRKALQVRPNPRRTADYLIVLTTQLAPPMLGPGVELAVNYVPDSRLVDTSNWEGYRTLIDRQGWGSIEDLATALLDDVRDVIDPRWIGIALRRQPPGGGSYRVVMEYRRSGWNNAAIIARATLL